jgi:hypothetical protein
MLPEGAKASHAMGADIAYQCLGGDSFLVTFTFFYDCDGVVSAPTNAIINAVSATCGLPSQSF